MLLASEVTNYLRITYFESFLGGVHKYCLIENKQFPPFRLYKGRGVKGHSQSALSSRVLPQQHLYTGGLCCLPAAHNANHHNMAEGGHADQSEQLAQSTQRVQSGMWRKMLEYEGLLVTLCKRALGRQEQSERERDTDRKREREKERGGWPGQCLFAS